MVNEGADMLKELEEQLQAFKFKSTSISIDEWIGTRVVENVYKREKVETFKSTEDRLLNRLKLWIDVCRIEKIENNKRFEDEKFLNAKRSKAKKSKIKSSISLESIHVHSSYPKTEINEKLTKKGGITLDGNLSSKSGTSRSANDLRNSADGITVDIKLSDSSSSSTLGTEGDTSCLTSNKKTKIKFWSNLFGRKSNEHKTEEMKIEEGKWRWKTPKLHRKKNSKVADGTLKHVRSGADISHHLKPLPSKFDIDCIFRTPDNRKYLKPKMVIGSTPCARKYDKQNKDLKNKCNTDAVCRRNTNSNSKRNRDSVQYKCKNDSSYHKQNNRSNDKGNKDFNDTRNTDSHYKHYKCNTDSNERRAASSGYTQERKSVPVETFTKIIKKENNVIEPINNNNIRRDGRKEHTSHMSIMRRSMTDITITDTYYIDSIKESKNSIRKCAEDIRTILRSSPDIINKKNNIDFINSVSPNTTRNPPKFNPASLNVGTPDISRVTRSNEIEKLSKDDNRHSWSDSFILLQKGDSHLEYMGYI